LTFAVPGVMPAAYAANANLFVSAENSQFDNYMSGPQVIEVVVIDSDINDTDEAKGEPDVTINGKNLRMVQAVDGNWYGYFADRDQAQIADSTVASANAGSGLDFGTFCAASSGTTVLGFSTTETDGFAIPITANVTSGVTANGTVVGSSTGGVISNTCVALTTAGSTNNGTGQGNALNVVREAKDPVSQRSTVTRGQIGLADGDGVWPVIQLYALNPTGNVVVQYNKGGGVQSTTLTFDTVDQFAELSLDRDVYPRLAQVHATITDLWLNIDPTDEDSWTFATNTGNATSIDTFYQVFDENGASGGNAVTLKATLSNLMCEDNCVLKLNDDAQSSGTTVITLQDNGDSILTQLNSTASVNNASAFGVQTATEVLGQYSFPVTITEQGPNSGVFGTYDESDSSVLKITSNANRGTSASLDYNETPQTILVGFDFASIDIQPVDDEWSSGEEIPVVIVDADQNKNSRADEDLDLNNPNVTLIPALKTGTPFSLKNGNTVQAQFFNTTIAASSTVDTIGDITVLPSANLAGNGTITVTVDKFSDRAILDLTAVGNSTATVSALLLDTNSTLATLQSTVKDASSSSITAFNFFNYDIRSLEPADGVVDVFIINSTKPILDTTGTMQITDVSDVTLQIVDGGDETGYVRVSNTASDAIYEQITNSADDQYVGILFQFTTALSAISTTADNDPIVADFFSFGFTDDGVQSSEDLQTK